MNTKEVLIEAEFDYSATVAQMCQCREELNLMDCNCAGASRWDAGSLEIVTVRETRAVNILKKYPVSHIRIFDSMGVDEHYRAKWSTVRKEIGESRICKRAAEREAEE